MSLRHVARHAGLSFNPTMHMARHTFATTVTLTQGVPLETVSKMLGHKRITTTQIYARITNDKIGAVARRNSLLVFGVCFGTLSALTYFYTVGFLLTAFDTIAFQHQMTMVNTDIPGESAERNSTLPTYLDIGEVGGSI